MLVLLPGATIFSTEIGHYGIHYPSETITKTFSELTQIPIEKNLPFICKDKTLQAFLISSSLAKEFGFKYPVIWA